MPTSYFLPSMPEGLEGLIDLALDLRWSWNHAADELWRKIAPELWDRTGNPWLILQTVSSSNLQNLAADASFRKLLDTSISGHKEALEVPVWFQFNVPMDPRGAITDDLRISAVLPTIDYLLSQQAWIIPCSHLDRPNGKVVKYQ